jgi:hypothetical protein
MKFWRIIPSLRIMFLIKIFFKLVILGRRLYRLMLFQIFYSPSFRPRPLLSTFYHWLFVIFIIWCYVLHMLPASWNGPQKLVVMRIAYCSFPPQSLYCQGRNWVSRWNIHRSTFNDTAAFCCASFVTSYSPSDMQNFVKTLQFNVNFNILYISTVSRDA